MVEFSPIPNFHIGSIPIFGNLILAPMDGISDSSFRSITRQLGSAFSVTEFINALDVINRFQYVKKRLVFREIERPLIFQIYDDQPDRIIRAANTLLPLKPDAFDINMGCCAPSVANRGAGAGLLRSPEKIATIFSSLTRTISLPITGKIRLGWDDSSRNYLEVAKIIEQNGGYLISVHGRTQQQKYNGHADWNAIAQVKKSVSIPVIGNGDVRCKADIRKLLDETGCDGVMIGRASLDNPWIFSGFDRHEVKVELVRNTLQLHFQLLSEDHGEPRAIILLRKFVSRYLSPYRPDPDFRKSLLTQTDPKTFFELLDQFLSTTPEPTPARSILET